MPTRKSGSVFTKMSKNVKANSKTVQLKRLLWGVIGGFLYPIIPTVIQGMSGKKADGTFNIDMSGWKGVLTGGISTSLIGMASNRMEIAFGGIAAMTTHLIYVKANDKVAEMTGSPIFAFDRTATLQLTPLSDESLPPGMDYIPLPDGSRVIASKGPQMNDYTEGVADYAPNVADYTPAVSDYTPGISDGYAFEDMVQNGDF